MHRAYIVKQVHVLKPIYVAFPGSVQWTKVSIGLYDVRAHEGLIRPSMLYYLIRGGNNYGPIREDDWASYFSDGYLEHVPVVARRRIGPKAKSVIEED